MSVFPIEYFEKEENHIELAEDQKSFHYSLLLPNDDNQADMYSGEIVFTKEEQYGLIMRQFLENVLLGENTRVFEGYVARRILGGHNNNQTAYELFNNGRKEDFVETPNLSDKEQLHDLFIRFGGENAEELFNNFIIRSEGKQYVDTELKQWLKENLPTLFKATDTMAWSARWEVLNTTIVLGSFTDDPAHVPIVGRGDYRITPEWYCYYVAIRRLFDSQYQLWKAQVAAGRIQFQHFIRENYEPLFGLGVVFYSYDIFTSLLYSIVFDFVIDNSVSMSLRLRVSDYLKKPGADCHEFLQFLDEGFEPYRKSSGTSMRFVQEERRPKDNPEQGMPTDEDFLKYPSTGDNTAFYRASKFGSSSALRMSIIYKLFVFLVSQGKLENTQNNLMLFAFRLTGKSPYAIETDSKLSWLGPKSDYSLCYFAWYLCSNNENERSKPYDGRFWAKTGVFFEYADGSIYNANDEQSRRQDFSKGRDMIDDFACDLRETMDKLVIEQQRLMKGES